MHHLCIRSSFLLKLEGLVSKLYFDKGLVTLIQMLHPFVPQIDEHGDRHSQCPEDCPMAMILHRLVEDCGYPSCPRYIISTLSQGSHTYYRVRVILPHNVDLMEDELEVVGEGYTQTEAVAEAAYGALARFCAIHSEDLEGTEAMYYPPADRARPEWGRRLRNLARTARNIKKRQLRDQVHLTTTFADMHEESSHNARDARVQMGALQDEMGHLQVQHHRDTSEIIRLQLRLQETERISDDRQRRFQQAQTTIADLNAHIQQDHQDIEELNDQVVALHLQMNQMQAPDEDEEEEDPEELEPVSSGATQGSSGVESGSIGPPPSPVPDFPQEFEGSEDGHSVNGGHD